MENLAGAGVLAIAALWAMYLLPQRVSQRTQVVEARTDDRHSGAMRILAVAHRDGRADPSATHDCPPRQIPHGRLLTGPMPVVIAQPTAAEGVLTMDRPVIASERRASAPAGHARGGTATPDRATAPASRASHEPARPAATTRSAATGQPSAARTGLSAAARARAEALSARRAAAARRRLALTLALLAATAIAWTAVSAFSIPVAVPAVLTAALVGVLGLGRRAVVTARRADAEAARRARGARVASAPSAHATARVDGARTARRAGTARGASVTGRAVHGSQTATQMISSAEVLERTTASTRRAGEVAEPAATAAAAASVHDAPAAPADASAEVAPTAERETPVVAADAGRVRGSRQTEDARRADDSERVLGGFSLPRPTYTMKAAAPRREVAPLTDADVTTPANAAERAAATAADAASAEEPATTTEGLGLGLDAILARRRASGA
ncbi:hypothetical protein ACTVCO_05575 [Sanguibacter sp. A247]|uniref:hypothetical protein n=1 Tax=unclassified Sanguibacter TaxID=2645534 RepID=UPI003FD8A5FD